jgi:hypothetical protein
MQYAKNYLPAEIHKPGSMVTGIRDKTLNLPTRYLPGLNQVTKTQKKTPTSCTRDEMIFCGSATFAFELLHGAVIS